MDITQPCTLKIWLTDSQADSLQLPHGSFAYIAEYDVDARDGLGQARLTIDKDEAIKWSDSKSALLAWKKQSTIRPLRNDGQPNKPLTAYSVELEVLE